jgi:hypothetical protein
MTFKSEKRGNFMRLLVSFARLPSKALQIR